MRYAEIIKDDEDPVVQMAKSRLNHSKIETDKNRLKVKQAQEKYLKKDIASKQRLKFKESDPNIDDIQKDIARDKEIIRVDHVGMKI